MQMVVAQEKKLLEEALKGGREGREHLFEAYAPKLLKVIRLYLPAGDEAREVLHDSFIKILEHLHRFVPDREGGLFVWMRQIAVHTACDRLRRQKQFRSLKLDGEMVEQLPDRIEEDSGPPPPPMDVLMGMIESLPPRQKLVFKLRYYEQVPHKEIADMLHIGEKTSSSYFWNARAALREMIMDYWNKRI